MAVSISVTCSSKLWVGVDTEKRPGDPFMCDPTWPAADPGRPLHDDEVHVWCANLDDLGADLDRFQRVLTAAELTRTAAYRYAVDRVRFVTARGMLRRVLGRYLELDAAAVPLQVTAFGKPVVEPVGSTAVQFNLAHAQGLALLAVTPRRQVGIDIEAVRDLPDMHSIASRFFAAAEVQTLLTLPAAQQVAAFFACWTRKEAFVKARGEGLTFPLDRFVVSLHPSEPAALLTVDGDPRAAGRWTMMALYPAAGYAAALVVEGTGWRLVSMRTIGS